jgi:hypothetical protein
MATVHMWLTPRHLYHRLYGSHATASTKHTLRNTISYAVYSYLRNWGLWGVGRRRGSSTFCCVCDNNFKGSILGCFKDSKVFEAVHYRKPLNLITQIVFGSFSQRWRWNMTHISMLIHTKGSHIMLLYASPVVINILSNLYCVWFFEYVSQFM